MWLPDADTHSAAVKILFLLAAITFVILLFITAPYGRHRVGSKLPDGPTIPNSLGWIVMESPSVIVFLFVFAQGLHRAEMVPLILLAVWQIHYIHRTFIFPLRLKSRGKRMPLYIAVLAFVFNLFNATLNASWISHLGRYDNAWLLEPGFLIGLVLFSIGMAINVHSDQILIKLRRPGESGYKIPHGGLYRWVSSPNYLGELLEWLGWALATWSPVGLGFAVYTAANLVPRAISNHRWYLETFPNYPPSRRRLIPGLW